MRVTQAQWSFLTWKLEFSKWKNFIYIKEELVSFLFLNVLNYFCILCLSWKEMVFVLNTVVSYHSSKLDLWFTKKPIIIIYIITNWLFIFVILFLNSFLLEKSFFFWIIILDDIIKQQSLIKKHNEHAVRSLTSSLELFISTDTTNSTQQSELSQAIYTPNNTALHTE